MGAMALDATQRKASSRLGAHANLLHGWIYFSPAAAEEYAALGLTDEQTYFASRAAPMGEVSAAVVTATFFNFHPDRVEQAIPRAWRQAPPADVQAARMRGAARILHGSVGDALDADSARAANEVAEAICDAVSYEGRPLAGANREVELPDDDLLLALWQRLTVIREWRGDAHVAVLTAAPVDAVEALVLHAGIGVMSKEALTLTRGWSEDEWAAGVERLRSRGLTESDGSLTDAGAAYRDEIEQRTDDVSWPLVAAVGGDAVHRFIDGLKPLREALLASGVFPRLR